MNEKACFSWIKPDRDIGVRKPHISFSRFADGRLMVDVRHWPNWPEDDGWSVACGYDLGDAWAAHMQQFEEYEDEGIAA